MKKETEMLKMKAEEGRQLYKRGDIDRETAEEKIKPYLNAVNEKAKKLAKEYKVSFKPVSFIGFTR